MKTICIYHSRDLDGWMSAAIVKKWFLKNNRNNSSLIGELKYHSLTGYAPDQEKLPQKAVGDQENIWFLGWDYGDKIPDLSDYDKVIMVDIAFPAKEMINIHESFNRANKELIYIDHHISAINDIKMNSRNGDIPFKGIRSTKFAACELTWKYFMQGMKGDPDKESEQDKMPEIVRLLGRYDCFGHKGTDEEQKVLEFQYAARAYISNYEEAYSSLMTIKDSTNISVLQIAGKAIYKYLRTEARQTYKKAFPVKFDEPVGNQKRSYPISTVRKFLCVNQERFNPINFGIDYHKDGYDGFACFWLKDKKWNWSLYNDNGEIDCSIIAKQYGGGGHKGAAGMVIDTEKLLQIIT